MSVKDESTLEEDYFADLLLDVEEDDLPVSNNRDDRMKAAFVESKKQYKAEHAFTERNWYLGLEKDVRELPVGSTDISTLAPDHRLVEANINHHLFHPTPSSSLKALQLCLSWIHQLHPTPPTKELLDSSLRAFVGLTKEDQVVEREKGREVVELTKKYWRVGGNSALSHSSARVLRILGSHKDAFITLILSISDRGIHLPFILDLHLTLTDWLSCLSLPSSSPAPANPEELQAVLKRLLEISVFLIAYISPASQHPLFPSPSDISPPRPTTETLPSPPVPSPEEAQRMSKILGLDAYEEKAFAKVCVKVAVLADRDGVGRDDEEAADAGRSVRTL